MIYTCEQHDGTSVVRFVGDLSGSKDKDLRTMFVELSKTDGNKVATDMSQVGYLDSAVLGTLVWGMKNLRQNGGDFRMFALQDFVKEIFSITRLDAAFGIFDTEQEALESYAEGGPA